MSQPLQVKDVDTTGRRVVFYAAAFGNIDSYGDIIQPGAFKKTIAERGPTGSDQLKYLNQHDTWQLGGKIVEAAEDSHGLLLTAKIAATTLGNDMLELEAEGAYEHSIGYKTIQSNTEARNGDEVNILTELMLYEGSAVTWGANPNTPTVSVVKSAFALQECDRLFKSMDKFDRLLRKGSLSDETCQQLELLHIQAKQALSDLLSQSLTPGAGLGVHPEPAEPTQKHSALELLFSSITAN